MRRIRSFALVITAVAGLTALLVAGGSARMGSRWRISLTFRKAGSSFAGNLERMSITGAASASLGSPKGMTAAGKTVAKPLK